MGVGVPPTAARGGREEDARQLVVCGALRGVTLWPEGGREEGGSDREGPQYNLAAAAFTTLHLLRHLRAHSDGLPGISQAPWPNLPS